VRLLIDVLSSYGIPVSTTQICKWAYTKKKIRNVQRCSTREIRNLPLGNAKWPYFGIYWIKSVQTRIFWERYWLLPARAVGCIMSAEFNESTDRQLGWWVSWFFFSEKRSSWLSSFV